jgi:hypothetical protein
MTTSAKVVSAPATVTSKGTAKPQVITQVKANVKFRGARADWYAVLLQYNGKPAQDFLAATTKKPPSVPKSGVQENSSGWLRYFVRSGICNLE